VERSGSLLTVGNPDIWRTSWQDLVRPEADLDDLRPTPLGARAFLADSAHAAMADDVVNQDGLRSMPRRLDIALSRSFDLREWPCAASRIPYELVLHCFRPTGVPKHVAAELDTVRPGKACAIAVEMDRPLVDHTPDPR
jgi:hypothetical protein